MESASSNGPGRSAGSAPEQAPPGPPAVPLGDAAPNFDDWPSQADVGAP